MQARSETVSQLKHEIASKNLPHRISLWAVIDNRGGLPRRSYASKSPHAAIVAESLIVEHNLHSLIVTQRVTVPVMRAVIETAHRYGRSVVGQTWAVDGKEAANLGIDELHTSSRVYASSKYSTEQLSKYTSISERLSIASRAWASIDWDATGNNRAMSDCKVCYCPCMYHAVSSGAGCGEWNDEDF